MDANPGQSEKWKECKEGEKGKKRVKRGSKQGVESEKITRMGLLRGAYSFVGWTATIVSVSDLPQNDLGIVSCGGARHGYFIVRLVLGGSAQPLGVPV